MAQNVLTFVLQLRKTPEKNLNQETDPTGDRPRTRCVRGNDVTPRPQQRSFFVDIRQLLGTHLAQTFSTATVPNFCLYSLLLFPLGMAILSLLRVCQSKSSW